MQTIDDLSNEQLLIVIQKIMSKFLPNRKMHWTEFQLMVIMLANEKTKPDFIDYNTPKLCECSALIPSVSGGRCTACGGVII